jgi:hypothetical protein
MLGFGGFRELQTNCRQSEDKVQTNLSIYPRPCRLCFSGISSAKEFLPRAPGPGAHARNFTSKGNTMPNELTPQAAALEQNAERFFELGALFASASEFLRTNIESDAMTPLMILGRRLADQYGGEVLQAFEDSQEPAAPR